MRPTHPERAPTPALRPDRFGGAEHGATLVALALGVPMALAAPWIMALASLPIEMARPWILGALAVAAGAHRCSAGMAKFRARRAPTRAIGELIETPSEEPVRVQGRIENVRGRHDAVVARTNGTTQVSAPFLVRDATGAALVDADLLVLADAPERGLFELHVGDEVVVAGKAGRGAVWLDDEADDACDAVLVFTEALGAPVVVARVSPAGAR